MAKGKSKANSAPSETPTGFQRAHHFLNYYCHQREYDPPSVERDGEGTCPFIRILVHNRILAVVDDNNLLAEQAAYIEAAEDLKSRHPVSWKHFCKEYPDIQPDPRDYLTEIDALNIRLAQKQKECAALQRVLDGLESQMHLHLYRQKIAIEATQRIHEASTKQILASVEAEHNAVIARHETAMQTQVAKSDSKISRLHEQHRATIQKLQTSHEAALSRQLHESQQEMEKVLTQHSETIRLCDHEHAEAVEHLCAKHVLQENELFACLEETLSQHTQELASIRQSHESTLETLHHQQGEEIKRLKETSDDQIQRMFLALFKSQAIHRAETSEFKMGFEAVLHNVSTNSVSIPNSPNLLDLPEPRPSHSNPSLQAETGTLMPESGQDDVPLGAEAQASMNGTQNIEPLLEHDSDPEPLHPTASEGSLFDTPLWAPQS